MASVVVLFLVIFACIVAPWYAGHMSQSDRFQSNVDGQITIGSITLDIMHADTAGFGLGETPIGPTWHGEYFLGADAQRRDVMARILYGGRNSLLGSFFDGDLFRTRRDRWHLRRFPWRLGRYGARATTGRAMGVSDQHSFQRSAAAHLHHRCRVCALCCAADLRGQVLSLNRSDFVLAARCLGIPAGRVLLAGHPAQCDNDADRFRALMMALNMLTESALSFLSIGVQPPSASWGTIIQDGEGLLYTQPVVAIAPGLAIIVTVLAVWLRDLIGVCIDTHSLAEHGWIWGSVALVQKGALRLEVLPQDHFG